MKNKKFLVFSVALVLFALAAGTVFADEYWISYGTYTRDDGVTRQGHSGRGAYQDEPSAVDRKNEGPIPHGVYRLRYIGNTSNLGPDVVECVPSGNNIMYGRSGFYIHGGTRSDGCIIINDPAFRRSLDGHSLVVR
jgi:hypothetical protein